MSDSIFQVINKKNQEVILETSIESRAILFCEDGQYVSHKHTINTNI